jgi:hypothetical protein
MALIFPIIFNLFLTAGHKKFGGSIASPDEKPLGLAELVHSLPSFFNTTLIFRIIKFTPKGKLLLNLTILLFGLIGGIAATISAMNAMLNSQFSGPCYAGLFQQENVIEDNVANLLANEDG